jgi:Mg2+/Co2+ transporter CorB
LNELPIQLIFAILAVLILLSAFFSSSETGMMSLNRYRLKHLTKEGHKGAKRADKLLKRPDRLISLILIGNNLVNFVAVSLATVLCIHFWGETLGPVIASVALTLIVLIFAEITPKTIAALHPEKVAFPASYILTPLLKVMMPLVWLINNVTNGLLKLAGIDPQAGADTALSSEELRSIVDDAGPLIPKRHQGMLLNILELEDVTIEDIMIPRGEVIGLNLEDDDETLLSQLRGLEFTRIPVFQEDINNIVGILHQRNVSRVIDDNGNLDRRLLRRQMLDPYFVPEATSLHQQLVNFQRAKKRMGMVVDEYGVVQGLVTLEDILEEIVGEFTSNLADETDDIHPQTDGSFLIDGTATIRDINKTLGWELPTDGPKTLNGLILENLESFPETSVAIQIESYGFEVMEVKDNILQTIKAIKLGSDSE